MSFTLCTSMAIVRKAGKNANSDAATSGALLAEWADEAESRIVSETRYDWVANYSSVITNAKPALAEAASCLAAMNVIIWDTSGFTSRPEAELLLDVLVDKANKNIAYLKELKHQEFMT